MRAGQKVASQSLIAIAYPTTSLHDRKYPFAQNAIPFSD